MHAKALCCVATKTVAVQDIELPDQLQAGEILVEKRYCGISPGTDRRCLSQATADNTPYIMGYSSVGVVSAVGEGVQMPIGRKVFCGGSKHVSMTSMWGAYTSHAIVDADSLVPVPETVDLRHAALTKLGAIAYHGVRQAKPMPHERIAVIGLGIIGQLAARLYQMTGAQVVAADPQEKRQQAAAAQGVGIATGSDLKAAFAPHFPDGADLVVDATGHPKVLNQSATLLKDLPWDDAPRPGPRLLLQGSYPGNIELDYQTVFMCQAPILIPRDSQRPDFEAFLDFIARGKLDVNDLTQDVRPVAQAQAAYDDLDKPDAPSLTTLLEW